MSAIRIKKIKKIIKWISGILTFPVGYELYVKIIGLPDICGRITLTLNIMYPVILELLFKYGF